MTSLRANGERRVARLAAFAAISGLIAILLGAGSALAETLRIGAQKSGTFGWELAVIKARGLDKSAGLNLEIVDLANTEAGKIAIGGGAVDVILSDWLWVSRERGLGRKLTFTPYSSALGAVMARSDGPIAGLADLKGKTLGVAGGPLDKSWLLLQAFAKRSGLDLGHDAHVVFGAPPLLTEKAAQGEIDATLQFWNFCADLEHRGFRRVVDMQDVEKGLGAAGPVAMVGYVFDEDFAVRNASALARIPRHCAASERHPGERRCAMARHHDAHWRKGSERRDALPEAIQRRRAASPDHGGRGRRAGPFPDVGGDWRRRARRPRGRTRSRNLL